MKSLQFRYSLLQVLYCFTTCAGCGFAAIFLGCKGLSNTLIGVATGAACVGSIFISPAISTLIRRVPGLTIPRTLELLYAGIVACFLAAALLPIPPIVVMALYATMYAALISITPFLAQFAMNLNRAGSPVNFGLARGLGSISYAVAAVALSLVIERLGPESLAILLTLGAAAFLVVLRSTAVSTGSALEGAPGSRVSCESSADTPISLFVQRPFLFMVLLGFTIAFIGMTCLSLYLIDIVVDRGGDTSMYGIAVFCMAASELPAMALVPWLRSRLSIGILFSISGVAFLIRNLAVVLAPGVELIFAGLLFQSMSYGLLTPLLTYYISDECGPQDEMLGQTMLAVMTTGIGSTVGTVAGGVLQDAFGLDAMLLFVGVTTVLGAVILIATGLKMHALQKRRRSALAE